MGTGVWNKLFDSGFEPFHSLLRDSHRFDHFLKRDLVGRMIEFLFLQPTKMAGFVANFGMVQKWPVLGNTDNRIPTAGEGGFGAR